MKSYVGRIPVQDASGCSFDIHEYRSRALFRRIRTYVLDTGEIVCPVDEHAFAVAKTGEVLVRVCAIDAAAA